MIARHRRALTLGVRAVVIEGEKRVFLIKHSYVQGWHFPGGGVEPRESIGNALARELEEEGGIELTAPRNSSASITSGSTRRAITSPSMCAASGGSHAS